MFRGDRRRWRDLTKGERHQELEAYLFLTPWITGFLAFTLGPILASAYMSLTTYDIFSPPEFVGLANYGDLFTNDSLFWQALKVTAIYTFTSVPLGIVCGYSLAVLLNQEIRGLSVYRTIYYLPALISGVPVALLWMWIFNPKLGLANTLLAKIGIQGPNWFWSKEWALPTLILTSLWGVGGGMVVYLSGLQSVPTPLYEAAELDGAGRLRRFWHITVPMTTPVILLNLITGMIGSFQVFTSGYLITQGGPANATLFYVLYLYNNGWRYFRMGYASALAWILFIIILVLTIIMFRFSDRWVYYEGALK